MNSWAQFTTGAPDQSHFYDALRYRPGIRLLHCTHDAANNSVHFELEQYDVAEHPPYVAVSYTWGSPYYPATLDGPFLDTLDFSESLQLNGKSFSLTKNMFDAILCAVNRLSIQHIWLDACCINQALAEECSSQVRQMHRIYHQA